MILLIMIIPFWVEFWDVSTLQVFPKIILKIYVVLCQFFLTGESSKLGSIFENIFVRILILINFVGMDMIVLAWKTCLERTNRFFQVFLWCGFCCVIKACRSLFDLKLVAN